MEENLNAGIPTATGETTPTPETKPSVEPTPTKVEEKVEKTFTQAQLDAIIKERLEKAKSKSLEEGGSNKSKELCDKYGVADLEELTALVEKGRSYDTILSESKESKVKLAFSNNKIDPSKEEDIKTFFKGLNKEITEIELQEQLKTHPEWAKKTIEVKNIGNDKRDIKQDEDVNSILKEYWGI